MVFSFISIECIISLYYLQYKAHIFVYKFPALQPQKWYNLCLKLYIFQCEVYLYFGIIIAGIDNRAYIIWEISRIII